LEAIKQEDNEANEGVFFPTIDIPLRCLCFLLFIGRRLMLSLVPSVYWSAFHVHLQLYREAKCPPGTRKDAN